MERNNDYTDAIIVDATDKIAMTVLMQWQYWGINSWLKKDRMRFPHTHSGKTKETLTQLRFDAPTVDALLAEYGRRIAEVERRRERRRLSKSDRDFLAIRSES